MTYVVLEHAGEDNQKEVFEATTFADCYDWQSEHYDLTELETLKVDIVKRLPDGSLTTEF